MSEFDYRKMGAGSECAGDPGEMTFDEAWFVGTLGEEPASHGASPSDTPEIANLDTDHHEQQLLARVRKVRDFLRGERLRRKSPTPSSLSDQVTPPPPTVRGHVSRSNLSALSSSPCFGLMDVFLGAHMAKFQVGDVVVLMSGGPDMTVKAVGPASPKPERTGLTLAADEVLAAWFPFEAGGYKSLESGRFNEATLKKR